MASAVPGSPVPPDAEAAASHRPAWIQLDRNAHVDDDCMNNETTAIAKSRGGHTVKVTFRFLPPPATTYYCVHCHSAPDSKPEDAEIDDYPHVVGADGRFILIGARFGSIYQRHEYFMYKGGGNGESATPDLLPLPDFRLPILREVGILPHGDGDQYLVAHLFLDLKSLSNYELVIYSSEDQRWRSIPLLNPCPEDFKVIVSTSKVVTLGEGVLGWVDLRHGMLVCDLRHEPHDARYIPLPKPLPKNIDELPPSPISARELRDLTYIDGVIKLIGIEHRVIVTIEYEKPSDPSDEDVLYDSDLIMSLKCEDIKKPEEVRSMDGWRVVIWSRTISSNCWHKRCVVDVDDISVDDATQSLLLSRLRNETGRKLTFRELYSAYPTLSMDSDDIFYLGTTVKFNEDDGWVVAVDLEKKTLKVHYFSTSFPLVYAYRGCSSSNHLEMTPGNC
ncbi:hypothetical protein ACP70R_047707 [Stipagrostis hirtigluma subsp. patula]